MHFSQVNLFGTVVNTNLSIAIWAFQERLRSGVKCIAAGGGRRGPGRKTGGEPGERIFLILVPSSFSSPFSPFSSFYPWIGCFQNCVTMKLCFGWPPIKSFKQNRTYVPIGVVGPVVITSRDWFRLCLRHARYHNLSCFIHGSPGELWKTITVT